MDLYQEVSPPLVKVGDAPPVMDHGKGVVKIKAKACKMIHGKEQQASTPASLRKFMDRNFPQLKVVKVHFDRCGRFYSVHVEDRHVLEGFDR